MSRRAYVILVILGVAILGVLIAILVAVNQPPEKDCSQWSGMDYFMCMED